MTKYITDSINVDINCDANNCADIVCKAISVSAKHVKSIKLYKQSVDARRKDKLHYVCRYIVDVNDAIKVSLKPYSEPEDFLNGKSKNNLQASNKHVVVVGSGPCGLMCARLLTSHGVKVTVIERGGDIVDRQLSVNNFFENGILNTDSNIQYGLGGAGTFSDGKLTTGISSPLTYTVFKEFVRNSAPSDIMYSNTPHIGTDKLVDVVANMRDTIVRCGGQFLFNTTMVDMVIENGITTAVLVKNNMSNEVETIVCDDVVLAIGHSARDTFEMLSPKLEMQPKPFAMGVRVEHDRQYISTQRYGQLALTHPDLKSANYKMAVNLPNGRNCYTFCMCPGGYVVPATSEKNSIVVNGMSNYDRMADNSNSALIVGVKVEDYYNGNALDGIEYQRKLESVAYNECNNADENKYLAPAQNVVDFIKCVPSTKLELVSSYCRGVKPCNLWNILPKYIAESIKQGLLQFNKTIKGFGTSGVLIAPESRTSSPVKLVRADGLCSTSIANVYPAGEGAGYAGGIVSAGVDGLKVALKICEKYNDNN